MNIAFIYEDNNEIKLIKDRIQKICNNLIRKIEVTNVVNEHYKNIAINKIMICIPKYKKNKLDKKLIKNLIYILRQNGIRNIVLSKALHSNIIFKNQLYAYNYNIMNGRFLMKTSIIDIINYIMDNAETNIKKEEISILVNENSNINIENIKNIANLAKRVNIITNNISRFKKIEKELYEEKGIILSIGNNRKKGLAKSKYIINIDFPEELLNKYKIYKKAIILNIENSCKINTKIFSGIIINNIEIKYDNINKEGLLEEFNKNEIYETKIIVIDNLTGINQIKKKDNFKIVNTIGNNGIINKNEFQFTKKLR